MAGVLARAFALVTGWGLARAAAEVCAFTLKLAGNEAEALLAWAGAGMVVLATAEGCTGAFTPATGWGRAAAAADEYAFRLKLAGNEVNAALTPCANAGTAAAGCGAGMARGVSCGGEAPRWSDCKVEVAAIACGAGLAGLAGLGGIVGLGGDGLAAGDIARGEVSCKSCSGMSRSNISAILAIDAGLISGVPSSAPEIALPWSDSLFSEARLFRGAMIVARLSHTRQPSQVPQSTDNLFSDRYRIFDRPGYNGQNGGRQQPGRQH